MTSFFKSKTNRSIAIFASVTLLLTLGYNHCGDGNEKLGFFKKESVNPPDNDDQEPLGFTIDSPVVLIPEEVLAGDLVGYDVAIDNQVAVAGALGDDGIGTNSGAAYVYRYKDNGDFSEWTSEAKLVASDWAENDQFGRQLDVSGDVIAVGAPYDDNENGNNSGAVYIFRHADGKWLEETKLIAPESAENDLFGLTIDVTGNKLFVGAYNSSARAANSGMVFYYEYDGFAWNLVQTILPTDIAEGDRFGYDIKHDKNQLIISSFYKTEGTYRGLGAAYIFTYEKDKWVQSAKLLPPTEDRANYINYGRGVDIQGDVAVVAAPYFDDRYGLWGVGRGYAYRKEGDNWVLDKKLIGSEETYNFGESVSISKGKIFLGSAGLSINEVGNVGAIFVFEKSGGEWTEIKRLTNPSGIVTGQFGQAIETSGNLLATGAQRQNENRGSLAIIPIDKIK